MLESNVFYLDKIIVENSLSLFKNLWRRQRYRIYVSDSIYIHLIDSTILYKECCHSPRQKKSVFFSLYTLLLSRIFWLKTLYKGYTYVCTFRFAIERTEWFLIVTNALVCLPIVLFYFGLKYINYSHYHLNEYFVIGDRLLTKW